MALTDDHPCQGYCHGQLGISPDDPSIDFESNQKQEETETDIRGQGEIRPRREGEYMFCESWDPTKRGGSKQDSTYKIGQKKLGIGRSRSSYPILRR